MAARARSIREAVQLASGVGVLHWAAVYAKVALQACTLLPSRLIARHPLGWTLPEELYYTLLRAMLHATDDAHKLRQSIFDGVERLRWLPGPHIVPVQAGGCDAYWLCASASQAAAPPRDDELVLYYVHGGGFISGSVLQYTYQLRHVLRELAAQGVACRILFVEYPLAPEHPYPAALHAVANAYEWLTDTFAGQVVVAGDSAGGNLALASLAYLRDKAPRGLRRPPLAMVLVSPAVDLRAHSDQVPSSCQDYLPLSMTPQWVEWYLQGASPDDPYVSPTLLPSFAGLVLGKMLVVAGGAEVMRPLIDALVERLRAGGGAVEYHVEQGHLHSYMLLPLPSLLQRVHVLVDFIAQQWRAFSAGQSSAHS